MTRSFRTQYKKRKQITPEMQKAIDAFYKPLTPQEEAEALRKAVEEQKERENDV